MAQRTQIEEAPKLVIEAAGEIYEVDLTDFDGREWHRIKQVTGGMSTGEVFLRAQMMDFDAIAALVWIHRSRNEPKLSFERVLGSLKLSNTQIIDDEEDADGEGEGEGLDGEGGAPPSPGGDDDSGES